MSKAWSLNPANHNGRLDNTPKSCSRLLFPGKTWNPEYDGGGRAASKMLNTVAVQTGKPKAGLGKVGFAEWFVLALTILFLAYFAYATPIIMVGVWHYKKHGFGDDDPGDDWDPPNVSVLVPVKNEERVVRRLLNALTRLDYPRENLEIVV